MPAFFAKRMNALFVNIRTNAHQNCLQPFESSITLSVIDSAGPPRNIQGGLRLDF